MDSNYGRGGVTSNEDVLRNFCTNTNEVKANNLSTHYDSNADELLLRQYGVLIAKRKGDKLMITSKRYSVTTSKVQNELLRIAMEYGLDVQKTNEFAKGGKLDENSENYSDYDKFYDVVFEYIKREENLTEAETKNICNVNESIIEAEFDGGSSPRFTGDVILGYLSNERGYMAKGGDIAQGNYEMILSQAKEVEHHVEELQNILKGEKDIDAWVVAKMENVSSTLSDITHYLDGKTEYAHGGKMSRGGYFGKDALVKDLSEEFASEELLAKFRKKSGIKDTQLTKPNVIAFAYTDYGGDFMDKVAIEYFLENHLKNIVVENTGYSGKNAIVWGKVAMDWVEATEDYPFGYEDFESFYYDKVYKEEEQAFSEYLHELQGSDTRGFSRFGSYELDYDEVLQWLLENKGGYYSITTTGLDFYADDLTQELLKEGLIEKSEEYAKGGMVGGYSVVLEAGDIKNSSFQNYLKRNGIKHEILSVQYSTAQVKFIGSKEALTKMINKFWSDIEESEMQELYDSIQKNEYAKGGNIKSKTNKKMATKKTNDGQTAPQIKRWLFAGSKGGYNYYNIEKRPYKKPVDEEKKGAPVGYRFSKFAEEKGITNNRFRKPTKSEVEQYAGKKKNGKLIMYRETRSNKSDVNPKKKI